MEGEQQVSTTASTTATGFGRTGGGNPPENLSGRGSGTGTGTAFGFCRVTIVAPDSRIDVALPDDVPVADIYPEVLRLSRQGPAEGAPVGYHLVRRDGTVLDSARTFAAQHILDGELLTLRPFSESLPPAVFDDVSEVVASAVTRDHLLWTGDLTRKAGLVGGTVLSALLAYVAWAAAPHHDTHGLPGILAAVTGVLLLTLAGVRARVYDDRASALALGLGALPNVAVAGAGLLPVAEGQGVGRLQFLLACAAVLTASVILGLLSPRGDGPFVAFGFASATGLAATFLAALWQLTPVETAALCAPLAVGALAFLPGLSMRFARLPIGFEPPLGTRGGYGTDPAPQEPVDAERIVAQARRGQELLVGLVGGCALVAIGSGVVLAFADDTWGQVLALATGIAMLMRAHLFRYTAQVAAVLAAGLMTLVLLGVGLCLALPVASAGDSAELDLRTIWLVAAIAAAAALVTGVGLIASRTGVTPFWGRFLEIAEAFVLLTLVPLTLAVFDVYAEARAMTS
ncbi:type VII secretion integral membrane protein EccD [Streptomyces venezuelae]|uniref:Type VII secretion integral membrane protein EccD n=1 Tax=Streptomyces venezuelae TaxID=54571 RepID=A0A5P2BZD0_STRVZ|nr:type VII secretion integral membrane protein EccD [Streptomyces venezuelae]